MLEGEIRYQGEMGAKAAFVIPGAETSWNPVAASRQGLADEKSDAVFDLAAMTGSRCKKKG